jgi:putative ABC transport system permease protein
MMALPLKYNIGNLTARRTSTAMTILGIAVVIAVMLSMMALYHGVKTAIVSSGSKDNLMIMREGADAELSSWVSKEAFRIIRALPGIEKAANGEPKISPELVIIFKLPKKDNPKGSNVTVRGVTPMAFEMRPYIKLVQGRMFRPGVNEIVVARRIRDRFLNCNVGDSFVFGPQRYNVVGVFEANGTNFDSEIWTDANFLGGARKRTAYSSVVLKPVDANAFNEIKNAIKNDNRLKFQVKSEYQYYADQTGALIGIKILVGFVAFCMVVGAVLGTMNTMFSAVASRKRELGTMRALGFKRRAIIGSVLVESAFISLLGGLAGLLLAFPVNGISTGTTNFSTFSEVAFSFRVDGSLAVAGVMLALVAGVIGGLLPAISAARMPIPQALREI